ncbi:unnamed protein product, partial [Candidula unifasciata]
MIKCEPADENSPDLDSCLQVHFGDVPGKTVSSKVRAGRNLVRKSSQTPETCETNEGGQNQEMEQ